MQESGDIGGGGADNAFEDAKAFNKGKGKTLAAMIGFVLAAVAAFGWYVLQDQPNPYSGLGKQVNGLKSKYFDGFFICALPGKMPGELKSDQDLRAEIDSRAVAGARYGAHLRKCAAPLRELSTGLRALLPPEEAVPLVKSMADSATKLNVGAEAFAGHLENLEAAYDPENGAQESDTLVRAWYEFKKAHADLNQLVKTKLGR
ncbi:MAG: hypothetical protein QM778_01045 [Myxococcales bacterium]